MEERTNAFGPSWARIPATARDGDRRPKERLTRERIVDAAMALMAERGYEAVSMRSLARALDTGQASLYAHVANRGELDQLVLDRICRELELPAPDPARWDEQLKQVLRDMLALFRAHPGSARTSLAQIPTMEGSLRVAEGMLAICLAGGISTQAAAWFVDVASLYVGAIAYEESIWMQREAAAATGGAADHEDVEARFRAVFEALPADRFPLLTVLAGELTGGDGEERFEFGLDLLVSGLASASARYRSR